MACLQEVVPFSALCQTKRSWQCLQEVVLFSTVPNQNRLRLPLDQENTNKERIEQYTRGTGNKNIVYTHDAEMHWETSKNVFCSRDMHGKNTNLI